jgi:hypothetical protein
VLDNPHPEGADDNNYVPFSVRLPDPDTRVTVTLIPDKWVVPDDYPADRPDSSVWQTDDGNFNPFDWELFNERTQSVIAAQTGFWYEDFAGVGPHYFVPQAEQVWWLNQESAAIDALSRRVEGGIELVLPADHLLTKRGFKNGDVITEIDERVPDGDLRDLLLMAARVGDGRVYLVLRRGSETITTAVILLGPEWKPARGPGPGPGPGASPSPTPSNTPPGEGE